jgi:hypothetical protein
MKKKYFTIKEGKILKQKDHSLKDNKIDISTNNYKKSERLITVMAI